MPMTLEVTPNPLLNSALLFSDSLSSCAELAEESGGMKSFSQLESIWIVLGATMLVCKADSGCCSPEEDGLRKEKLETNGTAVENRGLLHSQLQSKEKPAPADGVVSTRKEENDDLHINADDWSS